MPATFIKPRKSRDAVNHQAHRIFIAALLGIPLSARAEVAFDGSLGRAGSVAGPHYLINASDGRLVGSNLFHSFSKLNVATNETVEFAGPSSVSNVFARVTSGAPSTINGVLSCSIPLEFNSPFDQKTRYNKYHISAERPQNNTSTEVQPIQCG